MNTFFRRVSPCCRISFARSSRWRVSPNELLLLPPPPPIFASSEEELSTRNTPPARDLPTHMTRISPLDLPLAGETDNVMFCKLAQWCQYLDRTSHAGREHCLRIDYEV